MSPLEKIILTLHKQGLDEEQIYLELKNRNLLTNNTAHKIIDTIHTQKVYDHINSTDPKQTAIRIWGIICLLIGLAALAYTIAVAIKFKTITPTPPIIGVIMTITGIKLIKNPHTAFDTLD